MLLSYPLMVDPRVHNEAKTLIDAGHEVTVIVWDRKGDYEPEGTVNGIRVFRIHNRGLMSVLPHDLFRNPLWWRHAYLKGLALYSNDFQFDVVHCHDLDTLQAGVWLKKKLGIKLVYDAHEIFGYMISRTMPQFIAHFAFILEKKLLLFVDHIITVNEPLEKYFRSISSKPITIVMNCKDLISKEYIPPKNDCFTISYIGVLNKNRMFPQLMDMIGTIENVRFVIAAQRVSLYEEVKERSKSYANIEFLGPIRFDQVIPTTLGCNVIICMLDPRSNYSQVGLPNKIFDSMVTGRPIIVTRGLYYSTIIEKEGCGISVDYDIDQVKKAIIMLRDNNELCEHLGRKALKVAVKGYNWNVEKGKLLTVYEELAREMSHQESEQDSLL